MGAAPSRQELHLPTVPAAAGLQPCGSLLAPWLSLDLQPGRAWQSEGWEGGCRGLAPGFQRPSSSPASRDSLHQSLVSGLLFICTGPAPRGGAKLGVKAREGARVSVTYWAAPFGISEWQGPWVPVKQIGQWKPGLVTAPWDGTRTQTASRSLALSYSFPPGGLQGGFEHPLSPRPGFEAVFCKSLHWCFLKQGRVPSVWEGGAVGAVASWRFWGSLTCCSALRGSFSEWAIHSFIKSRTTGMRLTTPP